MQRLFSMFPKGSPGGALLMLRVALGLMIMDDAWKPLEARTIDAQAIASVVTALALCAGILTPVACVACVLLEVVAWMTLGTGWRQLHLCVMLDAVALGLLGPGGYSVDNRIFGRRRVVFPPMGERGDKR